RERISGLWMQMVLHHDAVRLVLAGDPGGPTHEAVDRVVRLRLAERDLMGTTVELVAAVLQPVRPGCEDLPPARRAHHVFPATVQEHTPAGRIRAQAAADLDHDRPLIPERDLELLARRSAFGPHQGSTSSGGAFTRRPTGHATGCGRQGA